MDVSSSLDRYIDDLEAELDKLLAVLAEISEFKPVGDSVDAHSVSYAAQLAKEALGLVPATLGTRSFTDATDPRTPR